MTPLTVDAAGATGIARLDTSRAWLQFPLSIIRGWTHRRGRDVLEAGLLSNTL